MSKKKHAEHVNHERWLVSYADFITMLFALFVVLYSTANADKNKPKSVAAAITAAFQELGIFPPGMRKPALDPSTGASVRVAAASLVTPIKTAPDAPPRHAVEQMEQNLRTALRKRVADNAVALRMTGEGLVISLRESGYYDSGSATPRADAQDSLQSIAHELAAGGHRIRVEGHTDNAPIHTAQFASNWELSTSRAVNLSRLLMAGGVHPDHVSVAGYAEFHPVADNATAEGRAQNRRVDIVVLRGTPAMGSLLAENQAGSSPLRSSE